MTSVGDDYDAYDVDDDVNGVYDVDGRMVVVLIL